MKTPRLSLTTRIFLSSAGIVIVVMAITLAVTQRSALRAADASIARGLDATQQRVQELVSSERAQLASRARVFAESPEYRSNIESDTGEFLDYTQTAAEQIGASWVQLVNREGLRLAKSDDPSAGRDVIGSPLARSALEGTSAEGFGVAGDTALIQVVAVPIPGAGGRIIGALMAAKYVTDSIARAVGSQTQSGVMFYVLDREEAPRLAGATDNVRRFSDILVARLRTDSNSVQLASAVDTTTSNVALQHVELGGERFVSRSVKLATVNGAPVGGFVALRSLDEELKATGYTDLRNTLLIAGAGGLLAALLVSLFTARRIVKPVTILADASRRAAEGDYQADIPVGGSDEIGTLASAFRRLLADLKDKQALVDFLSVSAAGGTRTQVLSATATTVRVATDGADLPMLAPGQTLGNRYEIKSVLGVGGMGMVYKANDRELGEVLAIKTLKPEMVTADSTALERFKSEIKLARRIAHRNVVRTYDLGESGGLYYISMEYVEGKSLKELIKERGRLPASAVMPIAKQLCRALEVSHEEGVIHRDIKPQNMVVQPDGVLKVMDFGIARLATRPAEAGHTQRGMVVGTPEYMAPEQLMGDELDVRADLYATGVVLYECLVGRVPLTAETPIALIARVLEETPVPPHHAQPDVPPALSDLVMWVLSKDRENRPRTAAELHTRLDQIALS
jgi:HAMP domain-containing protein/sensor domain CHASE-containing protein/predicted Ser/Thr protein kinase